MQTDLRQRQIYNCNRDAEKSVRANAFGTGLSPSVEPVPVSPPDGASIPFADTPEGINQARFAASNRARIAAEWNSLPDEPASIDQHIASLRDRNTKRWEELNAEWPE